MQSLELIIMTVMVVIVVLVMAIILIKKYDEKSLSVL